MPRLLKTLKRHIAMQTGNIKDYFENKALKKKYPEYVKNEFDNGYYKFIWGIKSSIDFSSAAPCLYSMNDIDICYDREKKEYVLCGKLLSEMLEEDLFPGDTVLLQHLLLCRFRLMENAPVTEKNPLFLKFYCSLH